MDPFNDRFHKHLGQVVGQVPEHDRVEFFPLEVKVLAQKPVGVEDLLAVAVRDQQVFVGRKPQQVFLVELVTQAGHEGNVGRRSGAEIENPQPVLPGYVFDELVKASGATGDTLTRHRGVFGPCGLW